jgi:hypothetical protein
MHTVYNFETKSIQTYILDSSKLKDMIGAIEQIEHISHGFLDEILDTLALNDQVKFARKAGGAFQAIFSDLDDAKRFQAVWTFCVQQAFPGLMFAQGMGTDDNLKTAIESARHDLFKHDHNAFFPTLPLAGPLVARSPRTGQAAVSRAKGGDRERLDAITESKRQDEFRKGTALIDKLEFEDRPIYWPINLDDKDQEEPDDKTFPLLPDNRFLGIVHADGNNLGQLLKAIQEQLLNKKIPGKEINTKHYAKLLRKYSQAIEDTTVYSAKQAIKKVVSKVAQRQFEIMPARPLVLGGDDFTFIVRGDLALDFTKVFLEEFETHSQKELTKLKNNFHDLKPVLPEQITACAGIAYIKASQPFYQGYHLAESLCKYAKNIAKEHVKAKERVPSCLAFHRITTSIIDKYETVLEREFRRELKNNGIQLTMQPYKVGNVDATEKSGELVQLDGLRELLKFLPKVSHGTFREYLSLLETSPEQAESAMQRWYDNQKKRGQTKLLDDLKEILELLHLDKQPTDSVKLVGSEITLGKTNRYLRTPIGDALALLSISKGSDYVSDPI